MTALEGRTVFLLEDEFIIAVDAESILSDMGAKVVVASDLDSARRAAEEVDADVAVLDVNINGQVSYPVAEIFRKRGIPIVFATGYELKTRGDEAARNAISVSKPYSRESLRQAVLRALAEGSIA